MSACEILNYQIINGYIYEDGYVEENAIDAVVCCLGKYDCFRERTGFDVLPIADPYILFYNDTYYAYGTSRADGFEVYSSKDLKSWERSPCLALSKEDSHGDKWFWAPEVYYVEEDKKFYMFYSVEEHVCVATSDSPLGPFVQDEKKPIREEKGIDTSVFFDEDGKAYLYFVRFTNGNVIWCAELKDNLKEIKEETLTQCVEATEPWELVFGKVAEGPSIVKQDGLYYMFYSANDFRSQDYAVGYATSDSPFGSWRKSEKNPLLHKVEELVGTGHGAPFGQGGQIPLYFPCP